MRSHAAVAVLQSSSEREHYEEASSRAFTPIDWIDYEFYDDDTLDGFAAALRSGRLAAVVVASNALHASRNIAALTGPLRQPLAEAVERGLGLLVLHQFVRPGKTLHLDFLPARLQVSLSGVTLHLPPELTWSSSYADRLRLDTPGVDLDALTGPGVWGHRPRAVFSRLTPRLPHAWEYSCSSTSEAGGEEPLLLRSRGSNGRVAVTALPLDWLRAEVVLRALVTRAVRPSGHLFLHPAGRSSADIATESLLAQSASPAAFVWREVLTSPEALDLAAAPAVHFSHVHVSSEWQWDQLDHLNADAIRRRLENGGSLTAHARGPSDARLVVALNAKPPYLRRAEGLSPSLLQFDPATATLTAMHAFALLSMAVGRACRDEEEVPAVLQPQAVRDRLLPAMLSRLNGQASVDNQVLPTAALLAIAVAIDSDVDVLTVKAWLDVELDCCTDATVADQAYLWLGRRAPVRDLDQADEEPLSPSATFALLHERRLNAQVGQRLLQDLADPRSSPLHVATIGYWLAADGAVDADAGDGQLLRSVAQHRDALVRVADHSRTEALTEPELLANAALVLVDAYAALVAGSDDDPLVRVGSPSAAELAAAQEEVAAARAELARLETQWRGRRSVVRGLVGVVTGLLAASVLVAWVILTFALVDDAQYRVTSFALLAAVGLPFLLWANAALSRLDVSPGWLTAVGEAASRLLKARQGDSA